MLLSLLATQNSFNKEDAAYKKWWKWARWSIAWAFGNFLSGIVTTFFSFNRMCYLKLPDFHVEEYERSNGLDATSTYSFYRLSAIIWIATRKPRHSPPAAVALRGRV